VIRNGTCDLVAAVDAGKVAVSAAARIAKRDTEQQQAIVERVNAGAKPTEAERQVRRGLLKAQARALPEGKHRIIYADPPWKYGDERVGMKSGYVPAAAHYPTMSTAEICELDVRELAADDAVLFLWATFPLLPDALEVVKAWGFKYKTAIVWDKERSNFGNYHDASAELLIVATCGSCTPDASDRISQVQRKASQRHSAKPEHFRRLIDLLYTDGARVELFRRGDAPQGWAVWGNEVSE
jgi:N6-adenosine-specific RNA methylase IME4